MKSFLRLANRKNVAPVVSLVAPHVVGENKPVDIKLGVALMRDHRVPVLTRLLALAAGILAVAVLDAFEFPLEMLLALVLPIIGMGINIAVDGVQYVAGSLLLAAAVLPYLAPKELVAQIRAERRGLALETVPVRR